MSPWIFRFLALVAGVCLALQAPINARLRVAVADPFIAAATSFLVGTLVLVTITIAMRAPMPSMNAIANVPWYAWTGGAIGAVYVVCSLVAVPRLGAAAMISIVVFGTMIAAVLLDQFGSLGLAQKSLTLSRFLGIALVAAGVVVLNGR